MQRLRQRLLPASTKSSSLISSMAGRPSRCPREVIVVAVPPYKIICLPEYYAASIAVKARATTIDRPRLGRISFRGPGRRAYLTRNMPPR